MSSDSQSNNTNLFEVATRLKLRFRCSKGLLDCEQLWDLPLTSEKNDSLDGIARAIAKEIRDAEDGESFVHKPRNSALADNKLKLEILKYVINWIQEDNQRKNDAKKNESSDQRLLEILERKELAELENLSKEEILARLTKKGS